MEQTWRWFGPNDGISLADVRQTGATGIVTALHSLPNGVVWSRADIATRRDMIQDAGLTWAMVESIPIHEDIKTGAPGWEIYAQNWARSLENLAAEGITRVCYNFMPVLDWTRTDLGYELPGGARCLRFDWDDYTAFDLFILRRPGADDDYDAAQIARAKKAFDAMDAAAISRLTDTILAGLPGAEESYSLDSFNAVLETYAGVDAAQLRANLAAFLNIVAPVAERLGMVLAIHPDDPPRPIFGLPRVVSCIADMEAIAAMYPHNCNGFTLCTGSYGVRADNDFGAMIDRFGDRIHFLHLRSVAREDDGHSFHEATHLGGSVDLADVVRRIVLLENATGRQLPFRPDHGHQIAFDLSAKSPAPGYPLGGRLTGLAELRGIERAVRMMLSQ